MGLPKKNAAAKPEQKKLLPGPKKAQVIKTAATPKKSTVAKNRELVSANTALQKSNTRLEISNEAITRQGRKEKASLSRHIKSGKDLTQKLAKSVERSSKNAKTAKTKLSRKDAELDQLNKELLTFTYISSHDLQEPLRNLQVLASLILEKEEQNLSDKGKDYFNRMQGSARRIQNLIRDLIDYYNTNKVIFKPELTNLDALLLEAKNDIKAIIDQSRASIISSGLNALTVVPFQFCKLFKELICNAIKFAQKDTDPEITIKTEIIKGKEIPAPGFTGRKKYCHLSFTDNGLGFDPSFRERIFEVFQKLHGKEYKGSGIGLATCRKIVENHGGTITAISTPGKGSTFDIYIPL